MLFSRTTSSPFTRHDPLQLTRIVCRRTYANSKSKNTKRKGRGRVPVQAVRRQRKEDHRYRTELFAYRREEIANVNAARRHRREDWDLGPLRPWREGVSAKPETGLSDTPGSDREIKDYFGEANERYGTLSMRAIQAIPVIPKHHRIKDWFFRIGDRVCLVEGRDGERGKIGTVIDIDTAREVVTVQGVNMVDVRRPRHITPEGESLIDTTEQPVSFRALRLVYPIQDPSTGTYRDCILNHLEAKNHRRDPFRSFDKEQQMVFDRYLMPQNVRIPWPEEEDPELEDTKSDTKRAEVEEATFVPTLLRPPMPEGVMSELLEADRAFRGEMKKFDPNAEESSREVKERVARLKETKKQLVPTGARNVARGRSSAKGDFMKSKELPNFDQATLKIIATHIEAARVKGGDDSKAGAMPPPSAPSEQHVVN